MNNGKGALSHHDIVPYKRPYARQGLEPAAGKKTSHQLSIRAAQWPCVKRRPELTERRFHVARYPDVSSGIPAMAK